MNASGSHCKACLALLLVLCGISCGPTAPAPTAGKTESARPLAPVRNDTLLLPATGQVSVKVVQEHMLDYPKLAGGTIGDYLLKGQRYQLFVVRAESNQDAALMLLDLKGAMQDAAYVPHMGGYAGSYAGKPTFAFAKLKFLAGVVGLPQKDADSIARQLAARLQ